MLDTFLNLFLLVLLVVLGTSGLGLVVHGIYDALREAQKPEAEKVETPKQKPPKPKPYERAA
jgi:Sec-independent protein translocase protein TatA